MSEDPKQNSIAVVGDKSMDESRKPQSQRVSAGDVFYRRSPTIKSSTLEATTTSSVLLLLHSTRSEDIQVFTPCRQLSSDWGAKGAECIGECLDRAGCHQRRSRN